MSSSEKKTLSTEEIEEKIRHYCAYQERSRLQVIRKLKTLGCAEEQIPGILDLLAAQNYQNEQRFTGQYVRSRAAKGWGPLKIAQALRRETGAVPPDEILRDADAGRKAVEKLEKELRKKKDELIRKEASLIREKLYYFCLRRGFDSETSIEVVKKLLR
jgi:regulatory protein